MGLFDKLKSIISKKEKIVENDEQLTEKTNVESVHEEKETIEDVLEPYLIQQGFLQRTPRGRIATPRAYLHFGLTTPERQV